MLSLQAYRGSIFHFLDNPIHVANPADAYQYWEDGVLLVENGKIKAVESAAKILPELPEGVELSSYQDALMIPGFVDNHLHFPQLATVAATASSCWDGWTIRFCRGRVTFLDKYTLGFDKDHMPPGADPKENFKDYVLGISDGVPKTPEWASAICGTDPDVIRQFAIEVATTKPTVFSSTSAPART